MRVCSIRGFVPYISVVLINAVIDLGHKIIIQNTVFKCYDGTTQITLTALVNACILLPFILFFTPAGFLADRFSKHLVIRWTVGLGIPLTALIYGSYLLGWFEAAFALTLLLAAHSAFYSPAKYGYIKEMAGKENLGMANGVVQAVTIVAILLGGIIFSLIFEALIGEAHTKDDILRAIAPCGVLLFAGAVVQTLISLRIPARKKGDATLRLDAHAYVRGTYLRHNLHKLHTHRTIWLSVLGLALFWGVNQVLFAAFGAYLKETAHVYSTVIAQGLLALGGLGIIAGSVTAGRLSQRGIETGVIPLAGLGMTICLAVIPILSHVPMLAGLLCLYGFFGGLFVVPLNALIQFSASDNDLGTILAGNNFVQNVCMLSFLVLTVLSSLAGLGSVPILTTLAVVMAAGAIRALIALPMAFLRFVLRTVFALHYRLQIHGLDNIPLHGGLLILGNHTSWIDWAVLHLAMPRPVRFVMTRNYYDRWYLRWFLDLYQVIPIYSGASASTLRIIGQALKNGECVALFPEGAISRNGQLGQFRSGFSIPAKQSQCPIVPFYLRGLWGSRWSAAGRHFRQHTGGLIRNVSLYFGPALPPTTSALELKQAVQRQSTLAWQDLSQTTIPAVWLRNVRKNPTRLAVADSTGARFTNEEMFCAAQALTRQVQTRSATTIALLLPPALDLLATLAVLLAGKTVLKLSPGMDIATSLAQADTQVLLTTRPCLAAVPDGPNNLDILFLEDFRSEPSALQRLALRMLPAWILPCPRLVPENTALVVAAPVWRSLSHSCLIAHARQDTALFSPSPDDILLAALPSGPDLTPLLSLLEALPVVCLQDIADIRSLDKLCTSFRVTLLCADSDTLTAYAHDPEIHPHLFASLRFVFSNHVSDHFTQKFALPVHAGFRPKESGLLATLNAPDVRHPTDQSIQEGRKPGSVGLPLPGTVLRIVDPHTLEDLPYGQRGLILMAGPQAAPAPDACLERDGLRWLKTGTLGWMDEDGFLFLDAADAAGVEG